MRDRATTKTVSAHPTSWDYDDVESTEPEQVNPVNNSMSRHGCTRRPPARLRDYVRH